MDQPSTYLPRPFCRRVVFQSRAERALGLRREGVVGLDGPAAHLLAQALLQEVGVPVEAGAANVPAGGADNEGLGVGLMQGGVGDLENLDEVLVAAVEVAGADGL